MKKTIPLAFVVFLVATSLFVPPAFAADEIPSGFKLVISEPGVRLYRKDYQNGTPDYVQVIDLSLGAEVVPMYGKITDSRTAKGVYGGPDPRLQSQALNKYWQKLSNISPNAFCVSNGQFFYMKESPTRLPFPLRVDGQVISDGYGLRDYPDQKLLLLLWPHKAEITPLDQDTLYNTSAAHAIAGLTEDARKSPTKFVGRTFVGVDDQDEDGQAEIVLIFTTHSARQKDAAGVLRSFGADQVMMFDGGGSAQLTCQGKAYVASERPIPQALGVLAAPEALHLSENIIEGQTTYTPVMTESVEPSVSNLQHAESEPMQIEEPKITTQTAGTSELSQISPVYTFKFEDVVWVPAVMAPVMAVVLILLVKQRLSA